MVQNNLIFASASFHPTRNNVLFKKKDLIKHEQEYLFCLEQLKRVVPENFEIYIVDNSIENSEDIISDNLRELLEGLNVIYTAESVNSKIKNIGVAELKELFHLESVLNFDKYSKICYFTSRRFITNPYVFEKTEQLEKEALLSNPDFVYLDGRVHKTEKNGMYNDMFFAMKSSTMKRYIEYSKNRIDHLEENMINSESNLYDFVTEFNISTEYIKFLGFFRYDYFSRRKYGRIKKRSIKHNYHFV
jgi:hypothetical protein